MDRTSIESAAVVVRVIQKVFFEWVFDQADADAAELWPAVLRADEALGRVLSILEKMRAKP